MDLPLSRPRHGEDDYERFSISMRVPHTGHFPVSSRFGFDKADARTCF